MAKRSGMTPARRPVTPPRCRHSASWLIDNGALEWCYQCGAWRRLRLVSESSNTVRPSTPWVRPTGNGGENPWQTWRTATDAYRKRMGIV
jgi:hypothetical protein